MKSLLLFALFPFLLGITGCAKPQIPFVEAKKTYTFFFENNRNWVKSKVLARTDDGWFLINTEAGARWVNGQQALMISENN